MIDLRYIFWKRNRIYLAAAAFALAACAWAWRLSR